MKKQLMGSMAILAIGIAAPGQGLANPDTDTSTGTRTASRAEAGTISGRVLNEETGTLLEGARIRLLELGREAIAGRDGSFSFGRLPAGRYTLQASYVGARTETVGVDVAAAGTARVQIALGSPLFSLDAVQVSARAEGLSEALTLQRNAPTYRTVVSADALGQIREGNIGDALVRLPGLSVETRAGVQRTATIRGLAPQYNTVTVDGLRMTNVDGNRDIALDSFPSNMLARVEVVKANTPDLPADAIGGTVNLITRSAFDQDGRVLEGEVGGSYNDLRGNWNRQASASFGDRFGPDGQFGLFTSVAYFHDRRGYDVVDTAYTVSADDRYRINRSLYYDRFEQKDKVGAGLALDWQVGEDTRLFLKALYNYDYRWLNHYGTDWRPNPAAIVSEQGDLVSTSNARVDAFAFYREPKNVFQMHTLGGSSRAGEWDLDYRAAWSRAKKDYPETIQIVTSFNGVDLAYDRSVRDFPSFTVTNGVDLSDLSRLQFRQAQVTQVPRVEDETTLDANARRMFFAGDTPWTFAAGVRATLKDASQAQPDTNRFTGLSGLSAGELLEFVDTPGFMGAANGRARLLGFYPDWRAYTRLVRDGTNLTRNAAAVLFADQTRAEADFSISEDIYAAYAQATVDFERLQLLGGLRWEQTRLASRANEVRIENGQVASVTPVFATSRYDKVLPGLHARFDASERVVLRGAVTQALSRPPPGDLVPSRQENAQMNQRIIGNPDLRPAESRNVDLSLEVYLPPVGVLSAGVFHKDIDNFVFSASRIAADGVDERTRVNGDGGKVLGMELVWSQQLDFLPGPLSGLGVEANYTRLDSKGAYPGRNDTLPFINSPDYIFNGILSWAQGPFGLRLSYNRLPDRLESVGGRPALDRYNAASSIWDVAARYRVGGGGEFFLNVKNLTDEPTVQFQGDRGNPTSVVYFGTQYNFGYKLNF